MVGFPGHPADSGVGESVGSCNLVGKDSSYFTRPVLTIKRDPPDIRQNSVRFISSTPDPEYCPNLDPDPGLYY